MALLHVSRLPARLMGGYLIFPDTPVLDSITNPPIGEALGPPSLHPVTLGLHHILVSKFIYCE